MRATAMPSVIALETALQIERARVLDFAERLTHSPVFKVSIWRSMAKGDTRSRLLSIPRPRGVAAAT
jgi:hypothetical protein